MEHNKEIAAKHTPGPWGRGANNENSSQIILSPEGKRIAEVYPISGNARLIAAAPELLEALIEARDALNGSPNTVGLHNQINSAISKATGAK